ncbi:MAG: tRNA lysidine(34) synthetase TilS [Clostridiales bacterium]|nr:MAG: tRNA lysidine(34) synthetase TilS [Clostridiales bacterium]
MIIDKTAKSKDGVKTLTFDLSKIPAGAVIRTREDGDVFTKFSGGTKKLGDYFTDKKIPKRERDEIPLVAIGKDVLIVVGTEISDKVKINENTKPEYIFEITSEDN